MKIYDMHMHSHGLLPAEPKKLLTSMEEVGVYGACIFSDAPDVDNTQYAHGGVGFEQRLERVLEWCDGYEGRLFPVLWIHPDERGIRKKVRIAAERGIVAFKLIPYNYHADCKKNMRLMHEIAELGKPVIYHAGGLWNDSASSKYLHPESYEALLTVPNLRFSLAHCAWPWMDECLAMFGKINYTRRVHGRTAEMFIDVAPGTPGFYRRMMFERMFGGVYDISHNTMFGIDVTANTYNKDYARGVIERDEALYREFGVSDEVKSRIFCDNLFRFLGLPKPEGV